MKTKCKVDNCDNVSKGHDYCEKHLSRIRRCGTIDLPIRVKKPCKVEGCKNEAGTRGKGLCNMHRIRLRLKGDVGGALPLKGQGGTGYISKTTGYRVFYRPNHPNAGKNGTIGEHVLIMSEILGRSLRKGESVHHKNGIKTDNSPHNLELMTSMHPFGQSVEDMVKFCRTYLDLYEKENQLINTPQEAKP